MKKMGIFLFLASLLLTSCAPKSENNVNNSISIQDVPTAKEVKEWETSEIYILKSQIEQIPLDTCEEYFANEVKTFLTTYEAVDLNNLTIKQDSLSVITGKNKKSLFNLEFEINIVIDTTSNVGSSKFAEEMSKQLLDFFEQYSYFNFKAKKLEINCFDLYHTKFYNRSCDFSIMNETVFVEQPEDEYAVQTLAFNFSKTNPDFIIQKFGVIPENNELYIEYLVSDNYFDYDKQKNIMADLEKISIDIKENLISQRITKKFVSSKNVCLLTISFCNGNLEDSYVTFNFEL